MRVSKQAAASVHGALGPGFGEILSPDALQFIAQLARKFEPRIAAQRAARQQRQTTVDAQQLPEFPQASAAIRAANWRIADIPADLTPRRVEISTAPTRRQLIESMNSGADSCVVDLEDAMSPHWSNVIQAQINLRDAVDRSISVAVADKSLGLNDRPATLILRPRGWHQVEKQLQVDGSAVSAALVDLGLYVLHNAERLLLQGSGIYLCLAKLESGEEARLWRDIIQYCEDQGRIDPDRTRVVAGIETVSAAFEAEEILYELKDCVVGLSCSQQHYLFSFIKTFRAFPEYVLPDWTDISEQAHCLRAYERQVIGICQRRGAHSMASRSARHAADENLLSSDQIAESLSIETYRELDKGFSGCAVADPLLVSVRQLAVEHAHRTGSRRELSDAESFVSAADLLQVVKSKITQRGLRSNIRSSLAGIAAWLTGAGTVLLDGRLQDTATTDLCRAQIWHWVQHETGILDEGRNVTYAYFKALLREEAGALKTEIGEQSFHRGGFRNAARILDQMTSSTDFAEFFAVPAYAELGQ